MKKDLDKLFSKSIQTYYFLLVIIVIIKLLGGNYFKIVYTNKTINIINDFITKWKLENVWYAITLYIYSVVIIGITCNDNSKRLKIYCLKCMPIIILLQYSKIYTGTIGLLIDFIYLFILSLPYLKNKITKDNIINYIIIITIYILTQALSIILRNCSLSNVANTFYVNMILSLDYFIIMIIVYKLYFMKGGKNLCQVVVSSGSQKLVSLKTSLVKLRKKFLNKKSKSKDNDAYLLSSLPTLEFIYNGYHCFNSFS